MTASPLLAFAAIRNEGPFLVEWVTWQRMLGFGVLVAHNDCTDRSPELLAALARAGWCESVEHRPRPGEPPKRSAYRAARAHPAVRRADWMLVCDVDEFPVLRRGDGTAPGFLAAVPDQVLGIAIHWMCFGNGGHRLWSDGLVHRQFLRRGEGVRGPNIFFKTLLREPRRWRQFSDHAPHGWDLAPGAPGPGGEAREGAMVDGALRPLARFSQEPGPIRFTAPEEISHEAAQVNHYVIRADESFDLKRGTPSASALKDRYTEAFYRARNHNGIEDRSALAYAPRFDPLWTEAMALPGVRRLHHLCCMDYAARLCASQGRDPETDPRWRHHRAEAERSA